MMSMLSGGDAKTRGVEEQRVDEVDVDGVADREGSTRGAEADDIGLGPRRADPQVQVVGVAEVYSGV
jgi:hypothetical protein